MCPCLSNGQLFGMIQDFIEGTHVTKQLLVLAQDREGKGIIQATVAVSASLKYIDFASLFLLALLFHRAEAKQPARLAFFSG